MRMKRMLSKIVKVFSGLSSFFMTACIHARPYRDVKSLSSVGKLCEHTHLPRMNCSSSKNNLRPLPRQIFQGMHTLNYWLLLHNFQGRKVVLRRLLSSFLSSPHHGSRHVASLNSSERMKDRTRDLHESRSFFPKLQLFTFAVFSLLRCFSTKSSKLEQLLDTRMSTVEYLPGLHCVERLERRLDELSCQASD